MRKFNLREALAGKPVVTRDGQKVTQLTLFEGRNGRPNLFGVVDGDVLSWYADGSGGRRNYEWNRLFMGEEEREILVQYWKNDNGDVRLVSNPRFNPLSEWRDEGFFHDHTETIKIKI